MNGPKSPNFIDYTAVLMERVARLPLNDREQEELAKLQRQKHSLVSKMMDLSRELEAWVSVTEADVAVRMAMENSQKARDQYLETLKSIGEQYKAVKVTEIAPAETEESPAEEAA